MKFTRKIRKIIRILGKVYCVLLYICNVCALIWVPIMLGEATGEFIWLIVEIFTLPLAISLIIFTFCEW